MTTYRYYKLCFVVILVWQGMGITLALNAQGLIQRVESPESTFDDQRKDWIGQEIQFLFQENAENEGKYIGFCWNPDYPRKSVAEYRRLAGKQGRIEEAWWGRTFNTNIRGKKEEEIVIFWKVRLPPEDEFVWYWDDGGSTMSGVGFLSDYDAARVRLGDSLWAKEFSILYTLDDEGVIRLRNLEKVTLIDVQWGEHSNYPIRFVLRTQNDQIGYRSEKYSDLFFPKWYQTNPRHKYPDWKWLYWAAIENRKLTTGMIPEMVRLAWGDPLAMDRIIGSPGNRLELWVYRGINKRVYGLFFHNEKLVFWQWKERKKVNRDIILFKLSHERIQKSCRVMIDWQKTADGKKDFVTFSW